MKPCLCSSYYNLSDVSHDSVNKFLSYLIEKSLVELEHSYCIEIGEVWLSHMHFNWKDRLSSFLTVELWLLLITEKFNKLIAIITSVWIFNFLTVCTSIVLFYVILSFIWNRIIGALNLWRMAELPLITIWSTKQLKCSRSVWSLNAVPKSCFQFWVWVSWHYCTVF